MEVACSQCGATYQFDASAIPQSGYDAQCTGCGNVFFVAPQPEDELVNVACTHCGAVYQFSSSALPEEGYDAQCTQCQEVFFVSPDAATPVDAGAEGSTTSPEEASEATAGALPEGSADSSNSAAAHPTLSEETPSANATPPAETAGADVPQLLTKAKAGPGAGEPGYAVEQPSATSAAAPEDALQPVGAEAAPSDTSTPEPSGAEAALSEMSTAEPVGAEAALSEMSTAEPVGAEAVAPSQEAEEPAEANGGASAKTGEAARLPRPSASYEDLNDMMALAAELGEPAPPPDGATLEEDFEQIMRRKRRRLSIAGLVLGSVALYALITYVALPRVFDLTLGKVVGIKLTVHPDAIPYVEKGKQALVEDTAEAYERAIEQLDGALSVDQRYPEALALSGLAHVFRGADLKERGREIHESGARAVAEIKALEELASSRRPPDYARRLKQLRAAAQKSNEQASKLFERGALEMSKAHEHLKLALDLYQDVPVVTEAAGIYYSTDSDRIPTAEKLLRHSIETREINEELPVGLDRVWAPYLRGAIKSHESKGGEEARKAFAEALDYEPDYQRARFRLAQVLEKTGNIEGARAMAKKILAAVPKHDKAKRLLEATKPRVTQARTAEKKGNKHKRRRPRRRR